MTISDCRWIDLKRFQDARGALSSIEAGQHVPFEIKRVFYLYDLQPGQTRAGHTNIRLHEVLVALNGSFEVEVEDATRKETFLVEKPERAFHVQPMVWRTLRNFAPGTVCLVICSEHYDPTDYYRDRAAWLDALSRGLRSPKA